MSDSIRGVWYMLVATFVFSLMTVFVKLLPDVPPMEVVFFRAVVAILLCHVSLYRLKIPAFGQAKALLILRGLSGAFALILNYYLIQQVPLAAASTLVYLAPIFTTILGIYFVGEKVRVLQFVFFALSFSGILLIQGFDARVSFFHLLIGISCSMLMGLAYNCVRKLARTEHPIVIMYYFPLLCLPVTLIGMLFDWKMPVGIEWLYLLMVGVTGQLAQYYLTRAYQIAEIATVSIASYTSMIFTLSLGFIMFCESFNAMTYLGMFLVMLGIISNILWQQKQYTRPVLVVE
jgi:drug/metabolite transporter (DMT)-like permease